jgi:hypothetical protein
MTKVARPTKRKPILMFVRLLGALLLVALALAPKAALAGGEPQHLFYTIGGNLMGNGAALYAIQLSGSKITTTEIGKGIGGTVTSYGCASLAMSPLTGKLYSMCVQDASTFPDGDMYLVTIDTNTGQATFPPSGTKNNTGIMAMAFSPDGTLYTVGGCNPYPDPPAEGGTFDCNPGAAGFNTLYTVDVNTGALTPIGPTGAPEYFMDLAFDRNGNLWGETSTLLPAYPPAVLYQIDLSTGKATNPVNLVGSSTIMGLAFDQNGKLYMTDFTLNPGFYLVDPKTGFERAIGALPFPFSTALELADPLK